MILGWKNQPKQVLIIRKPGEDEDVNNSFNELANWLVKVQNGTLFLTCKQYPDKCPRSVQPKELLCSK